MASCRAMFSCCAFKSWKGEKEREKKLINFGSPAKYRIEYLSLQRVGQTLQKCISMGRTTERRGEKQTLFLELLAVFTSINSRCSFCVSSAYSSSSRPFSSCSFKNCYYRSLPPPLWSCTNHLSRSLVHLSGHTNPKACSSCMTWDR